MLSAWRPRITLGVPLRVNPWVVTRTALPELWAVNLIEAPWSPPTFSQVIPDRSPESIKLPMVKFPGRVPPRITVEKLVWLVWLVWMWLPDDWLETPLLLAIDVVELLELALVFPPGLNEM